MSERAIYTMGIESLRLWPQWLEELNARAPTAIQYHANGSLAVAHSADDSELDQFYADLNHHLGADNNAQWLDRQQLQNLEPDIAQQFDRALYLPGEAHLDNRHLLSQLLSQIQALGGQCFDLTRVEFEPQPHCDNPQVNLATFDTVVDCRGMGAQASLPHLRGVRGEVLWVETPEVHLQRPIRMMHPRYKLYIVPKPNQRFIIGATEIESQDRSPVSVQSMLELCSALYTLNPAFAEARILELDANLRPSFWDNLPTVTCLHGTATQPQTRLTVNGLYRHGYLLAPYLVEQAINQLFQPMIQPDVTQTKL